MSCPFYLLLGPTFIQRILFACAIHLIQKMNRYEVPTTAMGWVFTSKCPRCKWLLGIPNHSHQCLLTEIPPTKKQGSKTIVQFFISKLSEDNSDKGHFCQRKGGKRKKKSKPFSLSEGSKKSPEIGSFGRKDSFSDPLSLSLKFFF